MTASLKSWQVLPHGRLTEIDRDILTVTGTIPMPVGEFERRMTVVRLEDGRLVIFSAIALDEDEMRQLEQYGTPAFLVVPGDHHRLDAKIWKARYPRMRVVTPAGARAKVEQEVAVDDGVSDFGDPAVRLVTVPGTGAHEAALLVTRPGGTTLVLNDIVANLRPRVGFRGWLLRLMHFAGERPQIPWPIKLALVANKAALQTQLLRWADLPLLKRILVSHGAPIDANPCGELRRLAASLG